MTIERMSVADYKAASDVHYLDVFGLHNMYEKMAFRRNTILVGPKGIGKSMSVASYAAKVGAPIVSFDCSEDVRRAQLLGMFILRGEETPFVLGPLTTAYELANECGQAVLNLEEINALTPQMQKVLNATADFRGRLVVPECKRVFQLKDGARLWIVGTMNTSVYGGVYTLNEDLKSRFRLIPLDYPTQKSERRIIADVVKRESLNVNNDTITKVMTLTHETRQKALDYALSTRDVIQLLQDISDIGLEQALWVISGKFEGEDLGTIHARVKAVFGIELDKKKLDVSSSAA